MTIKVLVVDDEPLARARACRLLQKKDNIELIGECVNGEDALEQINRLAPDLVFLDIQMPGLTGFDVITHITIEPAPFIIFVTAYDQYAIQAFEFHALDYLLKPYKDSRFDEALERAIAQIKLHQVDDFQQRLGSLKAQQDEQPQAKTKTPTLPSVDIEVSVQGRKKFINSNDIISIESDGNYVTFNVSDRQYLYRATIGSLEYDLAECGFFRIHRSILVNQAHLKRVVYLHSNNQYKLVLDNDAELVSARSYKDRVVRFLDQHPDFSL
jgi:two-component system LytT family response regulator